MSQGVGETCCLPKTAWPPTLHVIDVYFTSVYCNPSVFDTGSVAKISNSKQEFRNEKRVAEGEATMCVGNHSKVDKITIAYSLYLRD